MHTQLILVEFNNGFPGLYRISSNKAITPERILAHLKLKEGFNEKKDLFTCIETIEDLKLFDEVEPPTRYIVAAAHKKGDRIIVGARHYDAVIRQQIELTEGYDFWQDGEQGFIDQYGKFLNRSEALLVAKKNNQIRKKCGGDEKWLFSENLY